MPNYEEIRVLIFERLKGNEREMLKFLAEIVDQVSSNLDDETNKVVRFI